MSSTPKVDPIPNGPRVIPNLCVRDAASALEFYTRVFGFVETLRLTEPGGRVGHAELTLGNAQIFLAGEYPEVGHVSPTTVGASPILLTLYVGDVDATCARAVAAGATVTRPPADQFHGERTASIVDPFGHRWSLHSRIEEVTAEEMRRRFASMTAS